MENGEWGKWIPILCIYSFLPVLNPDPWNFIEGLLLYWKYLKLEREVTLVKIILENWKGLDGIPIHIIYFTFKIHKIGIHFPHSPFSMQSSQKYQLFSLFYHTCHMGKKHVISTRCQVHVCHTPLFIKNTDSNTYWLFNQFSITVFPLPHNTYYIICGKNTCIK
jgi:hypothetical protein